jgi:hypothetical protein
VTIALTAALFTIAAIAFAVVFAQICGRIDDADARIASLEGSVAVLTSIVGGLLIEIEASETRLETLEAFREQFDDTIVEPTVGLN